MRFLIHMSTSEEAGSLARMLRLWTWSTCADMETELWSPRRLRSGHRHLGPGRRASALRHGLLRLHGPAGLLLPPPGRIDSYSLHPDGFLQKPVRQSALFTLCAAAPSCGGTLWSGWRFSPTASGSAPPVRPDMGGGCRRGCLVHTLSGVHRQLWRPCPLPGRPGLPKGLFFRCQRSFLINLTHSGIWTARGFSCRTEP